MWSMDSETVNLGKLYVSSLQKDVGEIFFRVTTIAYYYSHGNVLEHLNY